MNIMHTMVYSYGAKPAVEGAHLIAEQIGKAHAYYNRLVELHREQYADVCSIRAALCPAVEAGEAAVSAADEAVEAAVDEIRRRNAAERRKRATSEEQEELASIRAVRAGFVEDLRASKARAKDNPALVAALAAIAIEYNGEVIPGSDPERRRGGKFKDARAACGVYFGTYLEVEKAIELAKATTTAAPLRFRRWSGDGLVAVQIQGGISVADLIACKDTRVRLEDTAQRSRRASIKLLWIRVGSDGRNPVWAKVPIYYALADGGSRRANRWNARSLPSDATVMGVQLIRRQVAVRRNSAGEWVPYYEWSVNFTLRTGDAKLRAVSGIGGVDLGWRLMPDDSLRVGYLVGADGANEQIALPAHLVAKFHHSEDIRSLRDGKFEQIKADLKSFLTQKSTIPDWLLAETTGILQWRGKGKLAWLMNKWAGQRFAGDEGIWSLLQSWQAKDAHLWQYERHNLISAQRTRQHIYRTVAARLRRTYRLIVVEDCDWRKLMRLPPPGSNESVNALVRWHQRIASVGMLRECLKSNGAVMVDAKDTTKTCSACGHVNDWEDPMELIHECAKCACVMDQDENAARNLLASGKVMEADNRKDESQPMNGKGDSHSIEDAASRESETVAESDVARPEPAYSNRWKRRKAARSQKQPQLTVPTGDG